MSLSPDTAWCGQADFEPLGKEISTAALRQYCSQEFTRRGGGREGGEWLKQFLETLERCPAPPATACIAIVTASLPDTANDASRSRSADRLADKLETRLERYRTIVSVRKHKELTSEVVDGRIRKVDSEGDENDESDESDFKAPAPLSPSPTAKGTLWGRYRQNERLRLVQVRQSPASPEPEPEPKPKLERQGPARFLDGTHSRA